MTRKIAIVGTAPTTFWEAPFNDPEWEIWSLNGAFEQIPRYDLWFEFHSWEGMAKEGLHPGYFQNLLKAAEGGKLYSTEAFPNHPNVRLFPKEEVKALCYRPYFTSSIAWMIGLAILEGVDEIGIWGVDMAGKEEYERQRPSCEYLLGLAQGKGIKITLPPSCPLLRSSLYNEELPSELQRYMRRAEAEYDSARDRMNYSLGVKEMIKELACKWG